MSVDLRAERARYCYDDVAAWHPSWRKDATQRVKGLPVQMRSQGLMVTVATLMADDKEHSRRLLDVLAKWLLTEAPRRASLRGNGSTPARQLLDACAKASRAEYASAQREAIALLDQIKIYADALVKGQA